MGTEGFGEVGSDVCAGTWAHSQWAHTWQPGDLVAVLKVTWYSED